MADIPAETYGQVTLDDLPKHTLLINTFSNRALVYDADTQDMLGMLSLGIGANAAEIETARGMVHIAESYYSRRTRGERTDVVTTYDIRTLAPLSEVVIPPKHASGSPMRHYSGVIKDGDTRLMLVTNITPAVSLSVVDLVNGVFLDEISTAGCGLVYPVAGLNFMQICGDGTAQAITLDKNGQELDRVRSKVFFNLEKDPLMEKPVSTPAGWIFNTFAGQFYYLNVRGGQITIEQLFNLDDIESGWRVGGMQPLAYYKDTKLLLLLMHQGGPDTHKDPGTEVWYYDISGKDVTHRLKLEDPATSIQVSQDNQPLLYVGSAIVDKVDIYDLKTTRIHGSIPEAGIPTILQNF